MTTINRRKMLGLLGGTVAAPFVLKGRYRVFARYPIDYSSRTVRLMEETTVVDLLNQFRFTDQTVKRPPAFEKDEWYDNWLQEPGSFTEPDAKTYLDSGINVLALGDGSSSFEEGLKFFAQWNGFIAQYSDWLLRIDDAADFERVRKQKKIGVMLTTQLIDFLRSPSDVDLFFGLGLRIAQLTYNFANRLGSGFLENRDGGLTVFGHKIMKRMEEVGIGVDLSHCGDQTTLDALEVATRPVLFTHAGCRAIAPGLLRLKTDEAIKKLAKTGGMIGIQFIRFMIREKEPVEIDHVIDHFDHVRKLVGIQHVGVGSDRDIYGESLPKTNGPQFSDQANFDRYKKHLRPDGRDAITGLDHPKRMFDLTEALIRRKYSDDEIRLILGGNAVRVLGEIWKPERGAVK